MANDSGRTPKTVPAVEKAIQVLLAFKDGQTQHGSAELGRMLNANRSTIFHILRTLEAYGFLHRDKATRKFKLGYALVGLGQLVLQSMDLRAIARPFMQELMDKTGEMIILSVLDRDAVLVIDLVESRRRLRTTVSIGTRLPLHATADGKTLLAWGADRLQNLRSDGASARKYTDATITDPDTFDAELALVRERGYACDNEEYVAGVRGLSAPVRDFGNEVVAAITLAGFGIADSQLPELTESIVRAAGQISLRLGANPLQT